jgi:hypothetical protein
VLFKDPLNKFTGIQKYKDNIKMLKDSPLFTGGKMTLHDVDIVSPNRVDTRWTLAMTFKPFPWQPVSVCPPCCALPQTCACIASISDTPEGLVALEGLLRLSFPLYPFYPFEPIYRSGILAAWQARSMEPARASAG